MSLSPTKLLGRNSSFPATLHYPVYTIPIDPSIPSFQEKISLPTTSSSTTTTSDNNPPLVCSEVDILLPREGIVHIFDPSKFDATKVSPAERKKIKKQLIDSLIEKASHEGGQTLVSNGSDKWGRHRRFYYYSIACNRIRICHNQPKERNDTKNSSLNNSRKKNSRVMGHQGSSKRTSTSLPTSKDFKCKMQFKIKCNNKCFFYIPSNACIHEGHSYECAEDIKSKGKRILNVDEENSRQKMSRTKTSSGGSSSAVGIFREHNTLLTRQFLKNHSRKDTISNKEGSLTKAQMMCTNDAETIATHLIEEHGCRVVIIRAKKGEMEDTPTISMEVSESCNTESNTSTRTTNQDIISSPDDAEAVKEYLKSSDGGSNRKNTLLALAFTNRQQYQLARSFSSTISLDSTHKACQIDNLSLLTVTVKDAFGLTSVVLSFWIPNQKTWMFRYILLKVIPKVFGLDFCLKVKALISDGDPQLIRSIQLAIDQFYRNAIRLPCTWHIVCPPLKNGHRTIVAKAHISKYWVQWFLRMLQKWVYTFMKSHEGLEDRDEYFVSKGLLSEFVKSDTLKKYLTSDGILAARLYIDKSIISYQDTFLACDRKYIHNKEREDNCGHEGTNFARKYMSDRVLPTDSVMTATEKLASYDRLVMYERKQLCFNEFKKEKLHTTRWSNLTTYYAGIAKQEEKLASETSYTWEYDHETKSIYVMKPYSLTVNINEDSDVLPDDNMQYLNDNVDPTSNPKEPNPQQQKNSKHTLKEIRRMNCPILLKHMNDFEVQDTESLMKDSNGLIPRFRRSRQIAIEKEGNEVKLKCSCGFYSRSGVICRHLFWVEKNIFPKLNLNEFSYKDIHPTCYSSYSYLCSREDDLNVNEKQMLDYLLDRASKDPVSVSVGSSCLNGEMTNASENFTNITTVLNKMNEAEYSSNNASNESPVNVFSLPAVERILNYSSSSARNALLSSSNVEDLDYEIEFSQNDDAFQNVRDMDNEFEIALSQATNNADDSDHNFKKTEIQKDFFELMNQIRPRDKEGFKIIAKHIQNAKEDLLEYNLKSQNVRSDDGMNDDQKSFFPNRSFGSKSKDMISKKYK